MLWALEQDIFEGPFLCLPQPTLWPPQRFISIPHVKYIHPIPMSSKSHSLIASAQNSKYHH